MVYADEYVKGVGLHRKVVMRIYGGEEGEKKEQKKKSKKEEKKESMTELYY